MAVIAGLLLIAVQSLLWAAAARAAARSPPPSCHLVLPRHCRAKNRSRGGAVGGPHAQHGPRFVRPVGQQAQRVGGLGGGGRSGGCPAGGGPGAPAEPVPRTNNQAQVAATRRGRRVAARRARQAAASRPRRQEEIYTLADYGYEPAEIARRVGTPVGEVELILSLRGRG